MGGVVGQRRRQLGTGETTTVEKELRIDLANGGMDRINLKRSTPIGKELT
jgi:hypothetical protein